VTVIGAQAGATHAGARSATYVTGRTVVLLLGGFGIAVALRVAIGGTDPARSTPAGLAFAAALVAMAVVCPTVTRVGAVPIVAGAAGAAVLCAPVVALRLAGAMPAHRPGGGFVSWAAVVAVVAVAEEAFLRGALYGAAERWRGPAAAVAVSAVAFGLLHVPLYGWHVLPVDVAAGVWLGALRQATGTWTTSAVTHTVADLAAWWLR
jgi:membrane protease YdiL (CAAX protease family)